MKNASAFPFSGHKPGGDLAEYESVTEWGLTKREMFAAMAMQGLCASDVIQKYLRDSTNWGSDEGLREITASSVYLADGLIEALK